VYSDIGQSPKIYEKKKNYIKKNRTLRYSRYACAGPAAPSTCSTAARPAATASAGKRIASCLSPLRRL